MLMVLSYREKKKLKTIPYKPVPKGTGVFVYLISDNILKGHILWPLDHIS